MRCSRVCARTSQHPRSGGSRRPSRDRRRPTGPARPAEPSHPRHHRTEPPRPARGANPASPIPIGSCSPAPACPSRRSPSGMPSRRRPCCPTWRGGRLAWCAARPAAAATASSRSTRPPACPTRSAASPSRIPKAGRRSCCASTPGTRWPPAPRSVAWRSHLWGSRADRIERPDRVVLDLDPDPAVGFRGDPPRRGRPGGTAARSRAGELPPS